MKKIIIAVIATIFAVITWKMWEDRQYPIPTLEMGRHFQGAGMWIWNLKKAENGNAKKIISKCRQNRINFLLIKTNDGQLVKGKDDCSGGETMQLTKQFVVACHQNSIAVHAWGFFYGNQAGKEAELVVKALHNVGADGFVFDTEEPMKNKAWKAKKMCQLVKAHQKTCLSCSLKKLAYSPFRNPEKHRALPYRIFGEYTDFMMPQIYWRYPNSVRPPIEVFTESYQQWLRMEKRWGKNRRLAKCVKPIIPVGQTMYHATPEEIRQWLGIARSYGGFSFWKWEDTDEAQWRTIRKWR